MGKRLSWIWIGILISSMAVFAGEKPKNKFYRIVKFDGVAAPKGFAARMAANQKTRTKTEGAVWIKRSDGALSCGMGEAQSLEAGASELKKAKVSVFQSMKSQDGKMHIQVCGAETGSENAYLISKKDVPKALALGFYEAKK